MDLSIASRYAALAERNRALIARRGYVGRGRKVWRPTEDQVLRALFPDYRALQEALPGRTYAALKNRARTLKLVEPRSQWTAAEASRLRRIYPTSTREELIAAFPRHDIVSIKAKACHIGLRKRRHPFRPTGFQILDLIRARAFTLNISMSELDAMASTGKYFEKAMWLRCREIDGRAAIQAVRALDGELTVKWLDDES